MKPLADLAYSRLVGRVSVPLYVGSSAPTSVEEQGDAFIALKDGQTFTRASMYGSAESRTLVVNIYVMPTPGEADADQRALRIFSEVDPLLNNVTQAEWAEVIVCTRDTVDMIAIPDSDGLLLSCRYSIQTWN